MSLTVINNTIALLTTQNIKKRITCHKPDDQLMTSNMYGLLTKCSVKMAGCWPSSFFACLWTETKSRSINSQKKNEANIQPS